MYELIAHATSSRTRDTCSRLIISSFGAAARCTVLAGWQQSCCRIGVGEAGCGRSIRAACACVWVRAPPRRLFHPRADHGTPLRTPRRCGSSHHLLHLCRVLWQLYSLWQQSLKRIRRAYHVPTPKFIDRAAASNYVVSSRRLLLLPQHEGLRRALAEPYAHDRWRCHAYGCGVPYIRGTADTR